jgi:THO complex subunit 3
LTIKTKGENINMSWSPDTNHLAVSNKDDLVSFIDLRGTDYIFNEIQRDVEVNQFCWDFKNEYFYMTTQNGTVEIYDYPGLELVYTLKAHSSNLYAIDFDPKGRYFVTAGGDAVLQLWDLESLLSVRSYSRAESSVRSVGLSFDCELLAYGSEEHKLDIVFLFN